MNNNQCLTGEEMREVGEVFIETVQHVLASYPPEGREGLQQLMMNFIAKYKPWAMVTPQGIGDLVEFVWTNSGFTDFLMMLSFVFFSRWGSSDEKIQALTNNLARGTGLVVRDENNAVPRQYSERLPDFSAAQSRIAANRWIAIALMLPLFIKVEFSGTSGNKK